MDETEQLRSSLVAMTTGVVSAYVGANSVRASDLPALISSIHAALSGLGAPQSSEPTKPTPPVSIKKSVTPDYLISLEDGRRYKSLGRHLSGRGLTPAAYRAKWGLPSDYPMTAPSYSARRSELAKASGLGRRQPDADATAAAVVSGPDDAAWENAAPTEAGETKSETAAESAIGAPPKRAVRRKKAAASSKE